MQFSETHIHYQLIQCNPSDRCSDYSEATQFRLHTVCKELNILPVKVNREHINEPFAFSTSVLRDFNPVAPRFFRNISCKSVVRHFFPSTRITIDCGKVAGSLCCNAVSPVPQIVVRSNVPNGGL